VVTGHGGRRIPKETLMYEVGLNNDKDHQYLAHTLDQIDQLLDSGIRRVVTTPPAPGSEISRLEKVSLQDPVDLSHSLSTASISALDSLAQTREILRSGSGFALTPMRAMMRTALMGAGRVGYVVLPDSPAEREKNAATVLAQEAKSYARAISAAKDFEGLREAKPPKDLVEHLQAQIAAHDKRRGAGDGAMIHRAADLIGQEVHTKDPSLHEDVVADNLAWIWHTASGAAHGFHWQEDTPGIYAADLGMVVSALAYVLDVETRLWN
jgi:hypothetical protein